MSAALPVGDFASVRDGLGPIARWERDREEPGVVAVIVQRVAEGERLKRICESRGWPYAVVAQWVSEREEVSKAYERALRIAADEFGQETVEIADGADGESVGVAKLRVDTRFKLASRLYRDRYGEQVQHNVSFDPFGDMLRRVSERKLAALRAAQTPTGERVIEGSHTVTVEPEPVFNGDPI